MMQGHDFDGSPDADCADAGMSIECSGDLYSTANDMLRWMSLARRPDRLLPTARLRVVNHAAYAYRDGLSAVLGPR